MKQITLSNNDIEVCKDCYRITNSKRWTYKVQAWFYRNDFIPWLWEKTYKTYIKLYIK